MNIFLRTFFWSFSFVHELNKLRSIRDDVSRVDKEYARK